MDGRCQLIARKLADALAHGLFLGRSNFDEKIASRLQTRAGLLDKSLENRETVRAAIQSQVRLKIAHARRQRLDGIMRECRADCL